MKRFIGFSCLATLLLITTACGLIEDEGDCPTVMNENFYRLFFEVDGDTAISDGFYGTVELEDGEVYSFACPAEVGETQSPVERRIECSSSEDIDGYDQLRLTGPGFPEVVAVTVSTVDETYEFDGEVDLDVSTSTPRCGGNYKTGRTTVVLSSD